MSEPEIYLNGEKIDSIEELSERMNEWQDAMIEDERNIMAFFGVSDDTAAAIQYLRSRSRHTPEKEQELINRDKAGNPIPLNDVLSGEF